MRASQLPGVSGEPPTGACAALSRQPRSELPGAGPPLLWVPSPPPGCLGPAAPCPEHHRSSLPPPRFGQPLWLSGHWNSWKKLPLG